MIEQQEQTYWARIYMSGPIEVAKQTIRAECLRAGLCVTVEPTTFIYTGGEEAGYVVGLIHYPRFPSHPVAIEARARDLMEKLLEATHQHSGLLMTPNVTTWISKREAAYGVQPCAKCNGTGWLGHGTDEQAPCVACATDGVCARCGGAGTVVTHGGGEQHPCPACGVPGAGKTADAKE